MIKKMMLLAVSAAAVIAFAVPATASAEWTEFGAPLENDAEVVFSGPANFEVPGFAGAHADVTAKLKLIAGTTTAEVLSFTDSNCTGTLALNGLPCTGTARNLPWHAEVDANGNIRIANIDLLTHYYSDAGHTSLVTQTVLKGNIIASPDNREEISSVTLSGEGVTANENPAIVGGTLGAEPEGVFGY